MRKIRKDIAVFVFAAAFILIGASTDSFPKLFALRPYLILKGKESVVESIDIVNSNIDSQLRYHNGLLDLNSFILRSTGTKVIKKDDTTIVVAENDMLSSPTGSVFEDKIAKAVESVSQLKSITEKNGADFLYVYAPEKNLDLILPAGIDNHAVGNHDCFISTLQKNSIPVLDLYARKESQGITAEEMYFVTDHHWKPESGFWAAKEICKELTNRYGFEYNEEYTDINNYNIKKYEKWFLGSQGKKVGKYFSSKGPDDISLITPKFKTSITESQPFKNKKRSGDFAHTVLYMNHIDHKDYYNLNPYAVYSGGDFRLQITVNELAPNDSKVLIVRDSFACAVTPFLALNCKELHTVDVRDSDRYVGEKPDLRDYIEQTDPDYVILLYTGTISSGDSRFDFF